MDDPCIWGNSSAEIRVAYSKAQLDEIKLDAMRKVQEAIVERIEAAIDAADSADQPIPAILTALRAQVLALDLRALLESEDGS